MEVRRKAFTLAEVLITLGIIGIVAALTIPLLIQHQQEVATVSQLKKTYSMLLQSMLLAVKDNGTVDQWGATTDDGVGSKIMLDTLANYLRVTKNCGYLGGCFSNTVSYRTLSGGSPQVNYQNLNGANSATLQLSDGSLVMLDYATSSTANIVVDVNGNKRPNQYGVDAFVFTLYPNTIYPVGTIGHTNFTFPNQCSTSVTSMDYGNGFPCTAWVLLENNMDYLHCNNLSWNGPTSCH